jgi:hypothetical protein
VLGRPSPWPCALRRGRCAALGTREEPWGGAVGGACSPAGGAGGVLPGWWRKNTVCFSYSRTQTEIMTPGTNEKHYLAGGLQLATGKLLYCLGPRKNNGLFRDLLTLLDTTYPASEVPRIYVVVDNYCIHKAKAVTQWLANHSRFTLLWLPTYCPRANPIERVFGDVHDKCTRNHTRKRLRDLVQDVERHIQANGPWQYKLSRLYDAPEVTAAVAHLAAEKQSKLAA